MTNEFNEDESLGQETKVLTPKELLEKRKKFLEQTKASRGFGHNTSSNSKGSSHNASGHKPRTHRPQGG